MRTSRPRTEVPPLPHHALPATHVVIDITADPERPGGRLVCQDGVESSYVDVLDPTHLEFEYLRHLARVVDVMHPKRLPMAMLQIGGGPCAFARYLDATRRDLRALVVERDAEVVAIAREWLGLETSPRLSVRVADGREALATVPDDSLDVVVIDAFDGVVVPHHLSTLEFTTDVRRVLRADGLHLINMIDLPPLAYVAGVAAALRDRYRAVAILADTATLTHKTSGNVVLVASDREIPTERIAPLAARDRSPWQVVWGRALDRLIGAAAPLLDDVAPDHPLAIFGPLWGRARDVRMRAEGGE